ncbi:hypothetical protein P167DRAFT_543043 [Morchella conica CCBAS932]|uniref:Uncharacterized protein n=1 Tax=Morchella conica CCBAS932 TaxID=1392247 RepID=A0A3N4KY93_9PEZI|nr:hypothetical protein P167DRAFT_543043 [Morchella conica CCBAS932]
MSSEYHAQAASWTLKNYLRLIVHEAFGQSQGYFTLQITRAGSGRPEGTRDGSTTTKGQGMLIPRIQQQSRRYYIALCAVCLESYHRAPWFIPKPKQRHCLTGDVHYRQDSPAGLPSSIPGLSFDLKRSVILGLHELARIPSRKTTQGPKDRPIEYYYSFEFDTSTELQNQKITLAPPKPNTRTRYQYS